MIQPIYTVLQRIAALVSTPNPANKNPRSHPALESGADYKNRVPEEHTPLKPLKEPEHKFKTDLLNKPAPGNEKKELKDIKDDIRELEKSKNQPAVKRTKSKTPILKEFAEEKRQWGEDKKMRSLDAPESKDPASIKKYFDKVKKIEDRKFNEEKKRLQSKKVLVQRALNEGQSS